MGDCEAMTQNEMDAAIFSATGRPYASLQQRQAFIAGMRAAETLAAAVGPDGYKSYQAINLAIRELEKP